MKVLKSGAAALAIAGFAWGGILGPPAALARGGPYDGFGFFDFGPPEPVGVPDENGCVKICFRDLSPCDPPLFKRTDGRCSQQPRSGGRR